MDHSLLVKSIAEYTRSLGWLQLLLTVVSETLEVNVAFVTALPVANAMMWREPLPPPTHTTTAMPWVTHAGSVEETP